MNSARHSVHLSIGLSALLLCGCGGSKLPGRSPVSGVVKLDGQPAANVFVQFIPLDEKKGRSASGQADANGKYSLSTFTTNDGAIPGEYKVIVASAPAEDKALQDLKKGTDSRPNAADGKKIPEKYSDAKKTELKATVNAAKNDIPLDLK